MILKSVMLIVCLQLPAGAAVAETLLFYDQYPPFSYKEDNKIKGLFVDVMKKAFARMNTNVEISSYPFKRALLLAAQGKGIAIGIYKTQEREKTYLYSKPFYIDKTVLFVKKGATFPYQGIEDLVGRRIATKLGWSYGTQFDQARKNGKFEAISGDIQDNFRRVIKNRVDAYIDNQLSGWFDAKRLGFHQQIEELPTAVIRGKLHIISKKGTRAKIVERFNNTIEAMKKDGALDKILSKYVVTESKRDAS